MKSIIIGIIKVLTFFLFAIPIAIIDAICGFVLFVFRFLRKQIYRIGMNYLLAMRMPPEFVKSDLYEIHYKYGGHF